MTAALRPAARTRVLADLVPGGLVRDLALVVGAAAFVGLTAQISIPLPFTPVPITLQTFAVLLSGAALGPMRGIAGMLLYLGAGMAGLPWFSEQRSGWEFASFGYIIGFVLAGALVGALARRGLDRSVVGTIGMMVVGNLVIYAIGVPYLAAHLQVSLTDAIGFGLTPFLAGDGLKILLAAGLLPAAWRLAGERRPQG
jgi:biotin transport system substrate-specific component